MCLVLFALDEVPEYRLVLLANRDEFYDRPTAPAGFWEDAPDVLAGRDLRAGGAWMGVSRSGRVAFVTNYRDLSSHKPEAPSRGGLVAGFLQRHEDPEAYLRRLAPEAERYNGFNLLVGDQRGLFYFSNREGAVRRLGPGLYGLSNHLLDTSWPKVASGKAALRRALSERRTEVEDLLDVLSDAARARDDLLPETGVGKDWERVLSSIFIESEGYGTRSSTVLLMGRDGQVTFAERSFAGGREMHETQVFQFRVTPEEPGQQRTHSD